jgi:recombination protein RecR
MAQRREPSAYGRLIDRLCELPGIGKRSAERIAFHLVKQPPETAQALSEAIRDFTQSLQVCSDCGHVSETDPCPICSDPERDQRTVLIVEQPSDVTTLEQTGLYNGLYHVLMGRLAPLEGIGPGELNVDRLLKRLDESNIREAILGTNPTLEGDGTAMYLAQQLEQRGIGVTRLARGLPTGSNLEQVSKAVLSDALQGRQDMPG